MPKDRTILKCSGNFGGASKDYPLREAILLNLKYARRPQSAIETARGVKRPVMGVWAELDAMKEECK
jgi:hypothetical protein